MGNMKLVKLFEPFQIKNVNLRNRIVMPPMGSRLALPDGAVSETLINYYEERARGGVGLIIVEYSYIDDKASKAIPGQLGVYDEKLIPLLNELAERIKAYGARVGLQINHAGRATSKAIIGRKPLSPSALTVPRGDEMTEELTIEEIEEIIEAYGEAARRTKAAGFDLVEIHGAHGYLICQFLSPLTNKRTDKYGSERAVFALEVLKRVREKVGEDFPIGFRISADEYIDGGITLELSKNYAKRLAEGGADYIHVSGGTIVTVDKFISPMYYPPGGLVYLAEEIKKDVKLPIITVGSIVDPLFAEKILLDGKADLVSMGRALIADPELPKKAVEGRLEDIRPCIRCNEGCYSRLREFKTQRCTVNPLVGREKRLEVTPANSPKNILVVGGGPAGMEAASIAALRGHKVTLFEKEKELGGQLRIASALPIKADIKKLLDFLSKQIKKLDIKVELDREIHSETIGKIRPDAVIVATGATPFFPDIPGINKSFVHTASDILMGKGEPGKNAIVAGGGMVGCETAIFLSERTKNVTIIEMLPEIGIDIEPNSRMVILKILRERGVKILNHVKLKEIKDGEIIVIDKNWKEYTLETENLIIALGSIANRSLVTELIDNNVEFYAIGDCVEPRKSINAIDEGFRIGREL
jgi:2,4-dienoyl-CoA reductase-like NADH-dependent reductase (Old Yellow Enzyme family)/thioredoxin reductase